MKMNKLKWALMALLLPAALIAQEKQDSVLRFSLKEAQEYALLNSPLIKNANLDIEAAKKKVWETTAIGLPQVKASLSMSYMITAPTFFEQFLTPSIAEAYANVPAPKKDSITFVNDELEKAIDDMRFSGTFDIQVSQLIFSGAYIVGLQTAKVYKGLSELALTKSKSDLTESVANSYFIALLAKENKILTDSILQNMQKLLIEMESMHKQGFIEETDIDQMSITVSTTKSMSDLLGRQIQIAENLFKYQIGAELGTKIEFTDNFYGIIENENFIAALVQEFDIENNVDYKLLDNQAKLMNLNVKLQKSAFLPDVAVYYQHQEQLKNNAFSFTPPDLVGLNVSIPIFTSGSRIAKVGQAKIEYQKAINTRNHVGTGLQIDYENSKSAFLTAKDNFETAKRNLELSKKIFNKTVIKYKAGMNSSFELNQIQSQYLRSQTSYFSAAMELHNAKSKLEKLLTQSTQN